MIAEEHEDFHWGTEPVDVEAWDLPGMKARFLVEHAPTVGKLVELGSGGGKMLRTLSVHRPQLELYGCDLRAPQKVPAGYTFSLLEGDGRTLPYGDASFDAVAIMDVLEHVPDPARVLDEVLRVLKPGGRLVAFVPCEGERFGLYALYRGVLGDDLYARTKEHIQAFSHTALNELIDARFCLVLRRYAYHALGQGMDATLFALTSIPALQRFFWQKNDYYNAPTEKPSFASKMFNRALRLGNALAFAESSVLSRQRWGAAGQLLVAKKS